MLQALAALLFILLFFLNQHYNYQREISFGVLLTLLFLIFGFIFSIRYNTTPILHDEGKMLATILETSEEKPNSIKNLIRINNVSLNDSSVNTNEKMLVYFEKSDVAAALGPGNVILFEASPQLIQNNGNPYEFDYQGYMSQKKIYRQVYLKSEAWRQTGETKFSLITLSEKAREKLLTIYRNQRLGENETEILSALTLGYKRGLDPETKQVFSSSGAMHILAVSGLHVGIIYAVFSWFFGFLRKRKYGKYLFILLSLFVLWTYAFITGLSPSVLRAATMFSLLCVATNINRNASIYNSLAIAAFVLLLINPNNLYEVGFQLSFAAVFGIVFLQPRLSTLWAVKNRLLKYFWTLLTVSIAAQIATFPFTAYYFNQFPSYFWLSNLVVIPAAFVLIVLGMSLLLFSQVPFLTTALAFVTKWCIHGIYLFLQTIENFPGSVVESGINQPQLILLILSIASAFAFLAHRRFFTLKFALFFIALFFSVGLFQRIEVYKNEEMIVYNNTSNPVVHLISGYNNYIVSESPINKTDFISQQIKTIRVKKHLTKTVFLTFNDEFENRDLLLKNGNICFRGKTIMVDSNEFKTINNPNCDYIISKRSKIIPNQLTSNNTLFISFSNYPKDETSENFFPVKNLGSYTNKWKCQK